MIVNDAVANGYAAANLAALDAGSGPSVIKFYTAPKPAGPNTAITTQTLLSSHACSDPAGSVSGRDLTLSAVGSDVSVDANGTAAWARHETSAGVAINDYTVSLTGEGGEVQLNIVAWTAGGIATITSGVIHF